MPDKDKNAELTYVVKHLLFNLGNLKSSELLCIVTDYDTKYLGNIFDEVAKSHGIKSTHISIAPLTIHGEEPPDYVSDIMTKSDLIIGLTTLSMAHTKARQKTSALGARYLSLPEYSVDLLKHDAMKVNFHEVAKKAMNLAEMFTKSNSLRIMTNLGTDIELDITGRNGNFAPGYVDDKIILGSPPDIEANVAPIENKTNGIVVVDGSIPMPRVGKLDEPITLKIKNGLIDSINGNSKIVKILTELFDRYGKKARILAECGVGFNDKAKLCGNMLIDEGCYGTMHFGFGSNTSLGGKNIVSFHLDFVFYAKELILNNECIRI